MRDWVEQVKERVDILEIAGRYTALKRVGRQFRGLCPFHQEKTPSFYVSPDKGLYKCFGCGEGGDAFTLLMKLEAIDFMEAARRLAAEYGIEIQERTRKISHDERRRLDRQQRLIADVDRGLWKALGIDDVADSFGIGRTIDETGEILVVPIHDQSDVPSGWLHYRIQRVIEGGVKRPEPLGLDPESAPGTEDMLFVPKDLRTQIVRRPLLVVDDPLLAVRLYAAGWGAVVAPVRPIGSSDATPALTDEHADRIARLGCRSVTFVVDFGEDAEIRRKVLRALHAAEPLLVRRGVEPLVVVAGDRAPCPDNRTWFGEEGIVERLQKILNDPGRTMDLFQLRVSSVQQLLARRKLTRHAAAEKLRPTLQAALAAEDRTLYHAYLAWAGRALGVRNRRELYRLVQVNPPAAAAEAEVF